LQPAAVGASIAPLVGGLVPSTYLPAYVDDVLEFANLAAFPATGETGKIYIALNNNKQYRWSGSAYIELVSSPGTTDSVPEGSLNLYFTAARVLAVLLSGLSLATGVPVVAGDSILVAIGKLQKQITDLSASVAGKLSNPMTTLGDLIYGAASGVATRLPIGQEGANLRVYNGQPAYLPNYKAWQSLRPANGTTGGAPLGIIISASGTVSHPTQDLTSKLTATRRIRFTGAATANASTGFYETSYTKARGNAAGIGGFHMEETFGQASNFTGQRAFIGLSKTMSQLAVDPSTLFNIVCVGYDATDLDTGNWQLMCNDASGAATRLDLPLAPRNATDLYRLTIHCDANDTGFSVRFENITTGVVAYNDKLTTNIPVATEFLNLKVNLHNGVVTQSSIIEHANYDAGIQD